MHIDKLVLENYRGFERLEFEPGPFCLLVGRNGSGKSSVLRAIELVFDDRSCTQHTDLHSGQSELKVTLQLGPHQFSAQSDGRYVDRRSTINVFVSTKPQVLKAFTLLTAQRSHSSGPLTELVPWFTKQENLENEVRLRENPDHRDPALQAIREALTRFLSALPDADYKNPRISRLGTHGQATRDGSLVFEKNGQPLAIQQLSDGEQVLLLTVMDQARRLVEAWPKADNPIDQQGILLIDEVALHLHPSWQRAALPALRETFPGVQIIATTHSPQVMASVPTASIQVLDNFQLHKAPVPVYGRDSNAILEELLEVPERPQAIKEALDRVSQHIDDEDLAAAQQALDELKEQLSSQDGEVVRLQTVLDFLAS